MPVPHLNLISMVGMGEKNEYLIWRKGIDGFFTALDTAGDIYTWCYSNGKLLYKIKQDKDMDGCRKKTHGYAVYRTDKDDNTYCRDYFEGSNRTI